MAIYAFFIVNVKQFLAKSNNFLIASSNSIFIHLDDEFLPRLCLREILFYQIMFGTQGLPVFYRVFSAFVFWFYMVSAYFNTIFFAFTTDNAFVVISFEYRLLYFGREIK
jgi:hypothetical protein